MKTISWRRQLQENPHLRDVGQWPVIPIEQLSNSDRQRFLSRLKMLSRVLSGHSISQIAQDFSCHVNQIYRLLRRTLASQIGQSPALRCGLIPNNHITQYRRRTSLTDLNNSTGSSGCFRYLIENVPGLRESLDKKIIADLNDHQNGENLTPKVFHHYLITYLREHNWPVDQYPFCHRSLAYESCRKYFHLKKESLRVIKKSMRVTETGVSQVGILEEVQIDEHTVDLNFSIGIEFNQQREFTRVNRVTLICAIDRASNFILSHKLCLEKSPDQYDFLQVIRNIYRENHLTAIKGNEIDYPNACRQLSLLDGKLNRCQIGLFALDNAWSHHAKSVETFVCERLIAGLNYGLVKTPLRRRAIEYIFHQFNHHIHRFKSTTGSHPNDPIKEPAKLAKKSPRVMYQDLEDLLNVLVAQHNITKSQSLQTSCPAERITKMFQFQYTGHTEYGGSVNSSHFMSSDTAVLHSGSRESSRPYIHFCRLKHKCKDTITLRKQKEPVNVLFDDNDIRKVTVYRKNGELLGDFLAPKSWQQYRHSLKTRKRVLNLIKQHRFRWEDPLKNYFCFQLEERKRPARALELLRIYKEFDTLRFGKEIESIDKRDTSDATEEYSETNAKTQSRAGQHQYWSINTITKRR